MIATLALTPVRDRTAQLLPAGAVAGLAIVWDGDELVALRRTSDSPASGVSPKNLGCSPMADWSLEGTEFERIVIAQGEHGRSIYCDAVSSWRLLTASALNGLGARALAIAVDYVKERKAFGVPIGWFQSVRHRLADCAVASDGSALLAYEGAWCDDLGESRAQEVAAMAFSSPAKRPFARVERHCSFTEVTVSLWSTTSRCFFAERRRGRWPSVTFDASIESSATISSRSLMETSKGLAGRADGLRFR